jgi:hypothetical protein
VTLDEALRELGIDAAATPEEARRAYLRGIKIRKPETDPEGFRRLREAYELLAEALARPEESQDAPPDAEIEKAPVPPELQALVDRLNELPAETHREERLALLREGIAEFPAVPGLRWWLIEELDRAERYGELLEALREAGRAGLPGFLETRALNYPDSLGPEDLERLEASGHPSILAVTAQAHLRSSRFEEAAAALGRAIDRLAEVDPHLLRPFPSWLPRGILALEAAGHTAEARALHERLWAWLSGTGDAALIERWGQEFQWMIVHELGMLDPRFPRELRRAAAFAALNGERESAVHTARSFAERDPGRAGKAAEALSGLPILHGLLFETLQSARPAPPGQVSQPAKRSSTWKSRGIFGLFLLALTGFIASFPSEQSRPAGPDPRQMLTQGVSEAWQILAESCDKPPRRLPLNVCAQAKEAVRNARTGYCPGVRRALDEMDSCLQNVNGAALVTVKRFKYRLLLSVSIACGTPGSDRAR